MFFLLALLLTIPAQASDWFDTHDYTAIVGTGPVGNRPLFDGTAIDDDSVIDEAADLEGANVLAWGTVQDDASEAVDGLVWAGLQDDTSGAKYAIVLHDQVLTVDTSSNAPRDGSGNALTAPPEWGGWQVLGRWKPTSTETVTSGPGTWAPATVDAWASIWEFMIDNAITDLSAVDVSAYTVDEGLLQWVVYETQAEWNAAGTSSAGLWIAILGCDGGDGDESTCSPSMGNNVGDLCDYMSDGAMVSALATCTGSNHTGYMLCSNCDGTCIADDTNSGGSSSEPWWQRLCEGIFGDFG